MPKKNTSEHSTSYAERYADETVGDSKQSNFALDHPPDDWRQTDFAHRFTDELKAINDSAAASFMFLLTHSRLMPKRGRFRSLRGHDFRSVSDSTRWAGTGTSRPRFALLPGAERDSHGHRDLVARCGRHQLGRGLLGGEVVGKSLGLARHGKDRFRGFPQGALQNPVDRGKLNRREDWAEEDRLVLETPDFRKELIVLEGGCLPRLDLLTFLTFDFVPDLFTRNGPSSGWRSPHISVDARECGDQP